MTAAGPSLTPFRIWMLAIRPKTLPAAAAPVVVGTGMALYEEVFRFWPALAALVGALLIQIGTNLANDYFDFKQGADTEERLGPTRVTQAGLLEPGQVAAGMWAAFGVAALSGIYLISEAGWPVLIIGLASILAGIAYTGGPFPFGYHGLGDVFVFVFFGPIAVAGTFFVQAQAISSGAVFASLPMGFLSTAILVVNNLRDIQTDSEAGKRTLAVRIGIRNTRLEYVLLCLLAYLSPVLMLWQGLAPYGILITWATLPLAAQLVRTVYTTSGRPLNKALAGTGRLELLFGLLIAAGLFIG